MAARVKELEKQMEKIQLKQAAGGMDALVKQAQTVNGIKLVAAELPGFNAAACARPRTA